MRTRDEIREMHAADHVDGQCHSLRHDLVFASPVLEGFVGPGFNSPCFGKRDATAGEIPDNLE